MLIRMADTVQTAMEKSNSPPLIRSYVLITEYYRDNYSVPRHPMSIGHIIIDVKGGTRN